MTAPGCRSCPDRRTSSTTGSHVELRQPRPRALEHDEVSLPLVARERLLQGADGLVVATGARQHFAEVGVGVRLGIQHLGPLAERDRLTRQALSFGVLPAASAHFCHYLPPEHLRDRVVACAKRRRAACPNVGLLESAEL